jgi:murein DD-endopeptidase MepM/ murein hydrolase activator NlpD
VASRFVYLVVLVAWIAALWWGLDFAARQKAVPVAVPTRQLDWPEFFAANILPGLPVADEFDTPLRPPDGLGAYVTLPFLYEGQGQGPKHLGEDWATAKGDASLGEPVYSVADGWVSVAQDSGPFGKVVFICYRLPEDRWPPFVEMMYAELNSIEVQAGQLVKRGQKIGTVGTAGGMYPAHLHWELRQTVGLGLGPGWDTRRDGWLGPSDFIVAHRGPRFQQPLLMKVLSDQERPGWGTDY